MRWHKPALVLVSVVALLVTGLPATSATAAIEYPSWSDIQAAKANEQTKASEIKRVQGLLLQLQQNLDAAQAKTDRLNNEFQTAMAELSKAEEKFEQLQFDAASAAADAENSRKQAGALIAQMSRTGGTDLSVEIYLSDKQAEELLQGLTTMTRLTELSDSIYEKAEQDKRLAESLSGQAKVAQDELAKLAEAAEQKLLEAEQAEAALGDAMVEQSANQAQLEAQLASLQSTTEELTKERAEGLEAERLEKLRLEAERKERERLAAEEKKRKEEAERLRQEQERAKEEQRALEEAERDRQRQAQTVETAPEPETKPDSGDSTTTPAVGTSGAVVYPIASGWYVSSSYGYRTIFGRLQFHRGVDMAAASGTPVRSVAAGTVSSVYYNSVRGNVIEVKHTINGQTTTTRYQHLRNNSNKVKVGQKVSKGQQISGVGSTGSSTGNHLHFEVLIGSSVVNPQRWLTNNT